MEFELTLEHIVRENLKQQQQQQQVQQVQFCVMGSGHHGCGCSQVAGLAHGAQVVVPVVLERASGAVPLPSGSSSGVKGGGGRQTLMETNRQGEGTGWVHKSVAPEQEMHLKAQHNTTK